MANLFLLTSHSALIQEKGLDWHTLDAIDTNLDYLFPNSDIPCPVEKSYQLPSEQQEIYISWIRQTLSLEKHCKVGGQNVYRVMVVQIHHAVA